MLRSSLVVVGSVEEKTWSTHTQNHDTETCTHGTVPYSGKFQLRTRIFANL